MDMSNGIGRVKGEAHPLVTLLPLLKLSLVAIAPAILFHQDLFIVFNDALQNESINYILAIPFLLFYLVYRKREMIKASIQLSSPRLFGNISFDDALGALLLITSLLVYWYGSYTFTPLEIHMFALPIFTSACILLLFNVHTLRQLVFPIIFLFLLVPPPAEILYNLGAILSMTSSELAFFGMAALGYPVSLGSEYGTPAIRVTQQNGSIVHLVVDVACSGIYSQLGFLVFALFIAYITRDKTWKKAVIFIIGFPLIYLFNVLRIFSIGVIAHYYGEAMALQVFHMLGGWMLIFLGTLILLIISDMVLKIQILSKGAEECQVCNGRSTKMYSLCPVCGRIRQKLGERFDWRDVPKAAIVILAILFVLSIQTPVFALTEGPPEIIIQTAQGEEVTTDILPQIPEYTLQYIYRDEKFEEQAGQDASLIYAYLPNNETQESIWTTIEIAPSRVSLHRWETCLITWPIRQGYQPWVEPIEQKDVELLENPPVIGRYFIFRKSKSNVTQAVLYWFETSLFQVNSTSRPKHVKISLIGYPDSLDELPHLKSQLLQVAKEVTLHWQPIKRWSPIALLISRNGERLVFAASIATSGTVLLYAIQRNKERKQNYAAYQKLSEDYRESVKAIHEAEKNRLSTLTNISMSYQDITGRKLHRETLLQRLSQLEEIGIVKRGIADKEDEPVQIWKPQFSLKD